jgi:CubicO group peptidase (beta-lactamase class C family)
MASWLVGAAAAPGDDARPPVPLAPLDFKSKIDPLAKPLVDDGYVVGCAIGIMKEDRTQVLAYGETEKGSGRAPDGDTVYEIGSITKTFTAIMLSDMARRGELKLDDAVQALLPQDQVTIPKRGEKPITLADLATHHSGLPRMPGNFKPADPRNPYADYTVKQLYEFLSASKPARDPGQGYEYSNLAVGLLGHILALKAQTGYESLLTDRILKPLKMSDTGITLTESQRKRLAPPYNAALKLDASWDLPTLAGAGAVRSTVNDMLKYLAANLATDEAPLTKSIAATHAPRHKIFGNQAIGLGWHIAGDGATRWHSGQTGGYACYAAFIPGRNIAVVVLANTASTEVPAFGESILRVALGIDVKPVVRRKAIEVDEATLKAYVGVYPIAPTLIMTITVEDGQLMAQLTGQEKLPLFAESKTKFFYKIVDAQVSFVADEKGAVTKLILHQNGRDMPAGKVK